MSTKASPLNAIANNSPPPQSSSTTNSNTMNTSSATAATPTVVKIKKELPSDEIKEFAESTMNELLGWYGFDSVDRLDLSAKTSKLLQSAGVLNSQQQQQQHHPAQHHMEKRRSRSSRAASLLHMHQQQHQSQTQQQQNEHLRALINSNNHNSSNNNNNNGSNDNNNTCNSSNAHRKPLTNCNSSNPYRSGGGGNDSTTSDHDTRSSRDDDSKSPSSAGKTHAAAANLVDEKIVDSQNCCWCRRPVPENAPEFLTTSDGPRYCSESCFTQSRRASFKKAKTCDWCRHVRHAVSYVDFQDGASQLQFCSDKCLNQYKMQIFCIETQAHLDMNPHLKEQGLEMANNDANLITPDLWLRNCRSRSASPASTISVSPGPPAQTNLSAERTSSTGALSPLPTRIAVTNSVSHTNSATSHKPLISVAPVSKLMSKSPSILPSRQSPKHNRKKRPVRTCVTNDLANNRASDMKSSCGGAPLERCNSKTKPLLTALNDNARASLNQTNTQTLTQFAASCAQDLHMNVPPLSPMLDSQSSQPTTPHSLPPTPNRGNSTNNLPPAFFATPPNTQGPQLPVPPTMGMTPQGFPHQRPPFMPNPAAGFLPRFMGNFAGLPPPPLPQAAGGLLQPDLTALSTLIGTPPPVTIMVPYPVIIPLPIPIPIPLPVIDFYKAHLKPEERKKFEEEQQMKTESQQRSETNHNNEDEPLDFTKTKEAYSPRQHRQEQNLENSPKPIEECTAAKEVETSPLNSTSSEDSQSNNSKSIMCVVTSEETSEQINRRISPNNNEESLSNDIQQGSNNEEGGGGGENTETNQQKLPKLKITRLQTKRTLMQTKESECSRPLRKRKRIIDCDFQKLNNNGNPTKDTTTNDVITEDLQETTTDNEELNTKGQNTTNNNCNKK